MNHCEFVIICGAGYLLCHIPPLELSQRVREVVCENENAELRELCNIELLDLKCRGLSFFSCFPLACVKYCGFEAVLRPYLDKSIILKYVRLLVLGR